MKILQTVAMIAALAAGVSGCATRLEMGPGYYHYDSRIASVEPANVVVQEPVVVYREPAVVKYRY